MSREQYFSYIQDENKFNKQNYTEMREGMVQPGQRLPLKKYGEMGRDEKNSFCGGYIASTLFFSRNLERRSSVKITRRSPRTLTAHYGQSFRIINWLSLPHREG